MSESILLFSEEFFAFCVLRSGTRIKRKSKLFIKSIKKRLRSRP
nr:MAG TPA: hypothetical protein [Caudoviricetes sp.]